MPKPQRLNKKARHGSATESNTIGNFIRAIDKLGSSASKAFSDIISQTLVEFANDQSIDAEERRATLTQIGNSAFARVSDLDFRPPTEVRRRWVDRDRSLGDTPFDHARREYPEVIKPGLLKIHFRIDAELYAAMRKKHWIDKEIAKHGRRYLDVYFLTKPEANERALSKLPVEISQRKLRRTLPKALQIQLRLLDAVRRRQARRLP
jgi:hypothetical protein